MNLIDVLSKSKEDSIYKCDLGFYVKKHRGYLLRLTYSEGWKYCSVHTEYVNAKYSVLSKKEIAELLCSYTYLIDEGYTSRFSCVEANTEFSVS